MFLIQGETHPANQWNSRITERIIPLFFQVCANNQGYPSLFHYSSSVCTQLAELQQSVCIRTSRKALLLSFIVSVWKTDYTNLERCRDIKTGNSNGFDRCFRFILISFRPGRAFISTLRKVKSYLLNGIKAPRRNRLYWRQFDQTNCPSRTWLVDATRELLFQCADMSLFFMPLIFVSSTRPTVSLLLFFFSYYALFPANYQTTLQRSASKQIPEWHFALDTQDNSYLQASFNNNIEQM